MKKILFFVDTLNEGGVSKVLLDLIENINLEKYDITVMCMYNMGPYVSDIKKYVKYKYCFDLPHNEDSSLRAYLYKKFWGGMLKLPSSVMYKYFVKEKYDIEIAFMHGWSTWFIAGSSNKYSKKLAWVHADLANWNQVDGIYRNIEHHKEVYNKFSKVLCVSEVVKKSMEEKYGLNNTHVIYNPINKEKISYLSKQDSNKLFLSDNMLNIISVGRLSYEKGYDMLLKAVKLIRDEGIKCKLVVIGSGQEYHTLNKFICDYHLQDDIVLQGFDKNPYKYMKNADIFVCPSRTEGFSLAVAEAMILELPIISTKCSGPVELTGNGRYGFLVEESISGLYVGLKEMIDSSELRDYYSSMSKIRSEIFCIKNFICAVENILDTV